MAMNREQFGMLVSRLEDYARQHPEKYKLRVGLLAALGYAYIFFVLGLLILIVVMLIWFSFYARLNFWVLKFGWVLLTLAAFILRALWVRIPTPEGLELRREDAPRLFEMVEEISSALQAPQPQHILLTDDFNASIVQVPRLGLLGWQQNYLVLGLPLMQALTPEQFRAVITHELGHLSGNHGRFFAWIYRVRMTWIQLLERFHQENRWGSGVFERFLNWYAPFFNAYSFVLARAQEYEADANARQLAGAQNLAEALINLEVKGKFLADNFWPGIYKEANQQAEPPPATFARMFSALRETVAADDAKRWLVQALRVKTNYEDTHPSLKDRLSALGYLPAGGPGSELQLTHLPAGVETTAAQHLLASGFEKFTAQLNLAWKEKASSAWRERNEYVREAQQKLRELEEKAQRQPLTAEETLNRALLTAELNGSEAAIPLLRNVLAAQPEDPSANFLLGRMLLEQTDATGISYIEAAMQREPESVLPGCELIYWYLIQQGQEEEAERYRQRAEQHYDLLELAQQERSGVSIRDQFQPHGLPAETVENLSKQLSYYPNIGGAYLVRKAVAYLPEQPFYVLGIVPYSRWYEFRSAKEDVSLVNQLAAELQIPGQAYIIILGRDFKWLKRVLRKIEGAVIYRR